MSLVCKISAPCCWCLASLAAALEPGAVRGEARKNLFRAQMLKLKSFAPLRKNAVNQLLFFFYLHFLRAHATCPLVATASDTKRKLRKTKTWSQLLFPPEGEKAGGVLARAFPLLFGDAGHPWCGAVSVDVRRRGPSSDPFRSLDRHRSPVSALFEAFYRIGGNAAGFSYSFWQVMQSLLGFGGAGFLGKCVYRRGCAIMPLWLSSIAEHISGLVP